ncbi:hypothetical protein [Kribbella deserti]|uniref:TrbL/VirB6 plasmid conjugal transfer protein n=1 Tax=Kribbella deserti TaxID=1926257 RepID=A0ABV6QU57_9ACTN
MSCSRVDIACKVGESMTNAAGGLVEDLAGKVGEMAVAGLKAVTTFWMTLDSPDLTETSERDGVIAFLQEHTLWIVLLLCTLSVIAAGARMAWEMRGESAQQLLKSLLTLVVVVGAAATVIQALIEIADVFSLWIIEQAMPNNESFESMLGSLVLATGAAAPVSPMPLLVTMFLGLAVFAASAMQVILMLVRSAMLVLLAGTFPIAAAATSTEIGREMFRKYCTWTIAFIAYKPAAAIIYAAAIKLAEKGLLNPGNALVNALTGFMMMLMAVLALPAMLRFIAPITTAVAGGSAGAGAGMAAAGGLATGAVAVGPRKPSWSNPTSSASVGGGGGGGASGALTAAAASLRAAGTGTQQAVGALTAATSHSAGESSSGSTPPSSTARPRPRSTARRPHANSPPPHNPTRAA